MISYDAVLAQMEQLVRHAKNTHNEQHMREQLTAVKALCEVVLGQAGSMPQHVVTAAQAVPLQKNQHTLIQQTASSDRLDEPDANGDSIFDF
ncbi:YwdI family protein [Lysinibacillus odysseyi]|uniref:Uncharacterized protein n=1 Tax=Lysinibacillus odysseyi 34hs-1 = NBRC 100172 TaxID=1220589 RepID=A0A0A3ILU8_9BACI|nr:YwdI family protein [Lysinibacillus odysseyi]KGR85746.1 hypothetical protein CD32_07800 [Lysinibacillus odysseyi 34hs-1 = NBRC 100172]